MKGIKSYLKGFGCNEPARAQDIASIEKELGMIFPKEYREFLLLSNGGEGFIGEGYAIFWKIEDLQRFNKEYGIKEFSADILLIGTNGANDAFGISSIDGICVFIMIPFEFEEDLIIEQGSKFTHLLDRLYNDKLFDLIAEKK